MGKKKSFKFSNRFASLRRLKNKIPIYDDIFIDSASFIILYRNNEKWKETKGEKLF